MLARFARLTHAVSSSFLAVNNTGLNVVCNQEYAQAVHHVSRICLLNELGLIGTVRMQQVHYHIIPAPTFDSASKASPILNKEVGAVDPPTYQEMHRQELEARDELDDTDAEVLVKKIVARL